MPAWCRAGVREPVTPSHHLLPIAHVLKAPSLGQTWVSPGQSGQTKAAPSEKASLEVLPPGS